MKRRPKAKKGAAVALGRWPGAGPRGTRKGMLTKRAKAMKVTLAKEGEVMNRYRVEQEDSYWIVVDRESDDVKICGTRAEARAWAARVEAMAKTVKGGSDETTG